MLHPVAVLPRAATDPVKCFIAQDREPKDELRDFPWGWLEGTGLAGARCSCGMFQKGSRERLAAVFVFVLGPVWEQIGDHGSRRGAKCHSVRKEGRRGQCGCLWAIRKLAQAKGRVARARLTPPSGFQEAALLTSGLPCCQGEFVPLESDLSCGVEDIANVFFPASLSCSQCPTYLQIHSYQIV